MMRAAVALIDSPRLRGQHQFYSQSPIRKGSDEVDNRCLMNCD
jgi:hypothetical protein